MNTEISGGQTLPDLSPADQVAFLHSILECTSESAVIATDLQGRILSWNAGAQRLYGHPADAVLGRSVQMLYAPDEQRNGRAQAYLEIARATGRWEGRIRPQGKDGARFTAHVSVVLRRDAAGRAAGLTLVAQDFSKLDRANRRVHECGEYVRALIEACPDGVLIADANGMITDVNGPLCGLVRCSREQLIGTPFAHHFLDLKGAEQVFLTAMAENHGVARELALLVRGGPRKEVQLLATALSGDGGVFFGVAIALRDVTEARRREEDLRRHSRELEEQNNRVEQTIRMKTEFLTQLAHDLRTPLHSIIGFAEFMHSGKAGALADAHREYLGDILSSARQLQQLINDVEDLARAEAGHIELRPRPLNLRAVLGETLDLAAVGAGQKQIAIELDVSPELETIVGDEARLRQIVHNYLSNAVKFTPAGGRVWLRGRPQGEERFRIEVEDTGIGIAQQDLPRLFTEFAKLDAGSGHRRQGFGLGLALTRRLVEAQGGTVGVESEPGRGTLFFAILPRRLPGSDVAAAA